MFIVPGAVGTGSMYNALIDAITHDPAAPPRNVRVVHWGAPGFLFAMNMSDAAVHQAAETDLVAAIKGWHAIHPKGSIMLVGHSAGAGVVLGALTKLPAALVDRALLLQPSVSPSYPITAPLKHVRDRIDVFYSDRDTLFLKWRTGTFGGYDRVKTPAAGYAGFNIDPLPAPLKAKLVQHPYQPAWESLKNDGGHFGVLSKDFCQQILLPLLR